MNQSKPFDYNEDPELIKKAPPRVQEESFVKSHLEILEMIATGKPASSVYNAIALMYEVRHPGIRCSMLELKGNKLMHGGAPSLPEEYCNAVNGLENGPSVGSCGTSTYTGKRVLVEDIATDPKWADIKHVALPHGMRCCWSEPIKNPKGKVLGAFGMYYNHPALPNKEELSDLESAARLAGIVMDREQREIALRQSENQYRTLVENLPQRFFLKDRNSVFISCSKNLAEDLGITPEQIVGTTDHDYFPQEIADQYQNDDQRIMQSRVTEELNESTIVDGQKIMIHTVKAPAMDEHGNVNGVLGIFWDVTDHKVLEEKFRQAQKMESVGTLVGGVAHEFNNTLAGIMTRLHLAKLSAKNNPETIRHIDIMSELSDRAAEIIRQLMAFSRKSTVQMRVFDLEAFINKTIGLHEVSIPENIKVDIHHSRCSLPIYGDISQLQQTLVNLLNNARDAVADVRKPHINITLDLFEADKSFIQLHPNHNVQRFAHLMVEDNGCGIPKENIDKIFDPFFTTKEVGKGTGLGLAMVYGAIQTHNGFIDVDSEPGKGTRMHIYIPLSLSLQLDEKREYSQIIPGRGEVILYVDDKASLRESGKEILESIGYSVLDASNGFEAVETFIANKDSISLIIMDIIMPEMGGIDAASAIKAVSPDVKIIFCTGYDKKHVINRNDLMDIPVITKPYKIHNLSRTISEILSS